MDISITLDMKRDKNTLSTVEKKELLMLKKKLFWMGMNYRKAIIIFPLVVDPLVQITNGWLMG